MESTVSLLVLRTSKMTDTLSFYRCLGLSLVEEKHGSGPVHFSTQVGSALLEIYPGEAAAPLDRKSSGAIMIGFAVKSLDSIVAALQKLGSQIITPPSESNWGRRAVVLDPDGRAVELSESKRNNA